MPPLSRCAPLTFWLLALLLAAGVGTPAPTSQARQPAPGAKGTLTAKEAEALWKTLGDADAARAFKAIFALAKHPAEAVALLKGRLRPVPAVDAKKLAQLVADLASDQEGTHRKAAEELERLDGLAQPALEKALKSELAPKARQRVEKLLKHLEGAVVGPERLQALRGLEVLEVIGTAEARAVLQSLAQGARGHRITEDARAAARRLAQRSDMSP